MVSEGVEASPFLSGIRPCLPGETLNNWTCSDAPVTPRSPIISCMNDSKSNPEIDFDQIVQTSETNDNEDEVEEEIPEELIKLPTRPDCKPVQQKLRRMRTDMLLKIREEVQKQLDAGFLKVAKYPEWVANIVSVPKKDGKVRMCVDYRDLNKASPKDNFPLPHIDTLVDNTAGHSWFSFMDGLSGYNQIKMHLEDMEKTTFVTLWGNLCYKVMPFGLKNAGATYQRSMVTLFHDMMHKEIEVYVDDMIAKSHTEEENLQNLRKLFLRLRKYRLRINPAKCTFAVTSGKLLGFIVRKKGIEVDPDKPYRTSHHLKHRRRLEDSWEG
ncbi:hypothetical protein V6N13_005088 [Hibiscus sabdariffa]